MNSAPFSFYASHIPKEWGSHREVATRVIGLVNFDVNFLSKDDFCCTEYNIVSVVSEIQKQYFIFKDIFFCSSVVKLSTPFNI